MNPENQAWQPLDPGGQALPSPPDEAELPASLDIEVPAAAAAAAVGEMVLTPRRGILPE
jgi:hypothetical protein